MALTCREASRASMASLGGHAAEAARLELEAHLARCARCLDQHTITAAVVRDLRATEPPGLSATAREAVRRAVAAYGPTPGAPPPRVAWPRRALAGAALLAAVGVATLLVVVGAFDGTSARRRDGVMGGDVAVVGGETPPGDAQGPAADVVSFRSVRGGRVRLDDAEVDLRGACEIGWTRAQRRVDLLRGALNVDVAHRRGQHFLVRTPRFTVEVIGTRFTVDLAGVRTERGVVRVLRPDGSVAARLEAGQVWQAEPLPAFGASSRDAAGSAAPVGVAAGAPDAAPATTRAAAVETPASSPATEVSPVGRARPPSATPVASRIDEARRALARGDAPAARREVVRLFHLGRDIAVEARVLFAESFLVEGRYADAIDGYRIVVRDFSASSQAESALFAIAQLEGEHGKSADARAALQAYLARYPHGRFSREASERLARSASREP